MRIGIFADIHGNIYALERVYKSMVKDRLDFHIFCGDICGYYYYQNEVIELLKEIKNLVCVAGNHDESFLQLLQNEKSDSDYESDYGETNAFLANCIKAENLTFLKKLPKSHIMKDYELGIFHGSPWDYLNEYIYPTSPLDRFRNVPYRFVLLGHTHYPMDRKEGGVRVVNPGSCGQPRDFNQPSYATIDLESGKVEFKRVQYDINLMVKDVLRRKEKNPYLIEVLKRTKSIHA